MKNFLIVFAIIAVLGGTIFLFSRLNETSLSPAQPNQNISPSPLWQKGDINHDGRADAMDKMIIKKSFNCRNSNPCWRRVVGKTDEGDNPIYVSDLDLNNDGVINNKDIDMIH